MHWKGGRPPPTHPFQGTQKGWMRINMSNVPGKGCSCVCDDEHKRHATMMHHGWPIGGQ